MATTNGWDTAYVIRMAAVNAAIVTKKTSPTAFTQTDSSTNPATSISGTFGDWQVTGGSGEKLEMSLPIKTCTVTGPGVSADIAGTVARIEVELQLLPQEGATVGTGPNDFKVNPGTVRFIDATYPDPQPDFSVKVPFESLLPAWLLAHVIDFDHVFTTVDLARQLHDQPGHQWLVPTFTRYAVGVDATTNQPTFAVLSMTLNRDASGRVQVVDPQAIPAGADAAFLMSPADVLMQMIRPGIVSVFDGAGVDDFVLRGAGTELSNNKELTFGDFELQNGQTRTTTLEPFALTVEVAGDKLITDFDGVDFNWSLGIDVRMRATAVHTLSLTEAKQFQVTLESVTPTAVVSASEGVLVASIVTMIFLEVVGAAIGTAVGSRFKTVPPDGTAMTPQGASIQAPPQNIDDDDDAGAPGNGNSGAKQAALETANPSNRSFFTGLFARVSPKVWGGLVGVLAGSVVSGIIGGIPSYIEADAEKATSSLPTIDNFLKNAVSTITWPNGVDFKLSTLQLNDTLQLGGSLQPTAPATTPQAPTAAGAA